MHEMARHLYWAVSWAAMVDRVAAGIIVVRGSLRDGTEVILKKQGHGDKESF